MESEKVKEIKKALEVYGKENKGITFLSGGEIKAIPYTDILTLINELESENERLLVVAKEKIHEIGEMGYNHAIETKKLKDDNAEIKNAKDRLLEEGKTLVWLNQNMCKENQQLKDRIAELEKEKEQTMKAWFEDREGMFWDGVGEGELKGYKQLKQFAERLKEMFNDTEYRAKTKRKTISIEELKAQIDWILHEVVIKNIDETLKEFINE